MATLLDSYYANKSQVLGTPVATPGGTTRQRGALLESYQKNKVQVFSQPKSQPIQRVTISQPEKPFIFQSAKNLISGITSGWIKEKISGAAKEIDKTLPTPLISDVSGFLSRARDQIVKELSGFGVRQAYAPAVEAGDQVVQAERQVEILKNKPIEELVREYQQTPSYERNRKANIFVGNLAKGITGGIIKSESEAPKTVTDKVIANTAEILGSVYTLNKIGGLFDGLLTKAGVGKFIDKYPRLAKYTVPFIKTTATFDVYGQLDPDTENRVKKLAEDTLLAVPFTLLGYVPKARFSVPASFGLGYGLAKLSGADNEDAFISGAILGLFDATGRLGKRGNINKQVADRIIRNESLDILSELSGVKLGKNPANAEIRKAYIEAVKKHHPDVGGNPETFKSVVAAYEFLTGKNIHPDFVKGEKAKAEEAKTPTSEKSKELEKIVPVTEAKVLIEEAPKPKGVKVEPKGVEVETKEEAQAKLLEYEGLPPKLLNEEDITEIERLKKIMGEPTVDIPAEVEEKASEDWTENYAEEYGNLAERADKLRRIIKEASKAEMAELQKTLNSVTARQTEMENEFVEKWRAEAISSVKTPTISKEILSAVEEFKGIERGASITNPTETYKLANTTDEAVRHFNFPTSEIEITRRALKHIVESRTVQKGITPEEVISRLPDILANPTHVLPNYDRRAKGIIPNSYLFAKTNGKVLIGIVEVVKEGNKLQVKTAFYKNKKDFLNLVKEVENAGGSPFSPIELPKKPRSERLSDLQRIQPEKTIAGAGKEVKFTTLAGQPLSEAIEKARSDIQQAREAMLMAPERAEFDSGIKTKSDYQKYIEETQGWIDKKLAEIKKVEPKAEESEEKKLVSADFKTKDDWWNFGSKVFSRWQALQSTNTKFSGKKEALPNEMALKELSRIFNASQGVVNTAINHYAYGGEAPLRKPKVEKPAERPMVRQPRPKPRVSGFPKTTTQSAFNALKTNKTQLPILKSLSVENGRMTATNLWVFFSIPTNEADGIYSYVGKDFIKQPNLSPEDFAAPPDFPKETIIKIPPAVLAEGLKKAAMFSSTDEGRPILTGVRIEARDGALSFTSTDGYRLFHREYKVETLKDISFNLGAPGTLYRVLGILPQDQPIEIKLGKEFVSFHSGQSWAASRGPEGEYPQVMNIMPGFQKQISFDKKAFIEAVKAIAPYVKEEAQITKAEIGDNKIVFSGGRSIDVGGVGVKEVEIPARISEVDIPEKAIMDGVVVMPVRLQGITEEENVVGLNNRYLADLANFFDGDKVFLRLATKDGKVDPLRPVHFSDIEEMWKEQEVVEAPQAEAPAYTEGGNNAAIGAFAVLENMTGKRPDLPSFRQVPFPEMVRIVKDLIQKYPQIKKSVGRIKALGGRVYAGEKGLGIKLRAGIFKDPELAAKILSHELGHIVDFLPEGEGRKGNLLGRIASLNGYLKHYLAEFPGDLGTLITEKEKRELRVEAKRMAEIPLQETKEVVVGEKLPSPDEILDIWRTTTAGIDNPELLSYIQKLSTELKKDIVKAAFRNTTPKWVTFKKQIKETITVGTIRNAPEDIRRLYKKFLRDEIIKRRLFDIEVVRKELQALSAEWRPFDRLKSSQNYVAYRDKPSELYADAISVLFNDPVRLKTSAPEFYRGFFNYLDQKPEVAEEYYQIQHLLSRGSDEVNKARLEDVYKGFEEGAKKRKEVFNQKLDKKSFIFRAVTQHVSKFHPIYWQLNKAIKEGKIGISRKQTIREALEEMAYSRNDIWLDLEKNETEVMEPLKKAGVTEKELGAWFMLERNLGDRLGIANPEGLIGEFNNEVKDFLAKNFTLEQRGALEKAVRTFHKTTFEIAEKMYKQGMIKESVFKEKIEPYKDSYVTYGVVKYIDKNFVTPYVKEMTGTLEAIENPLVTTMFKRSSMLQAIVSHKAKTEVVSFLKGFYPDEITESKSILGKNNQRIFRKAPGKGQLLLQERGDWMSYDVDPYFEQMFKQFDHKNLHTIVYAARQFNKYFKPTVTSYKLGWAVYNNPLRDVQRTMKNLAAISKLEGIKFDRGAFLRDWASSIPAGFKFANGELTPLAKEALGEHAISTPWVSYDPTAGEDKALYTLYQRYKFITRDTTRGNRETIKKFLLPIEMVLRGLEITGGTFESTSKLAGFKYLSKRLADGGKVGFYTRNYIGTPNYLEGGTMKPIDNDLWVFSNVIIQGLRSDAELLRNPRSRGAWMFETFLQSGIWKLLMVTAASGFLGKGLKDAYDRMTEYHKTNYLAFPLVTLSSGRVLYWTIPQDETNRLTGAIIWKTGTALQGKLTKPQQLLDVGAGFAPTFSPIFDVLGAWFDYMRGINPYDSYYGRNVLDQQTAEIRGVEGLKKMFLWSLNEVGLGNFATYDLAEKTTFEKFIQFTPLINRMFKVSDYGMVETELEAEKQEKRARAVQNKKESDPVKQYVNEYLKTGGDPDDFRDKIESDLYPEGPDTKEDKANLTRLQKDFDQEVLRRQGDIRVKTIMKLRLNTSRINTLKKYAGEMPPEDFEKLLDTLLEAKVISEDVYDQVVE